MRADDDQGRLWMVRALYAVDACQRAGFASVPAAVLQSTLYLTLAVDDVFGAGGVDERVLKHSHEVFDPQLQNAVDRLIVAGLLDVSDVQFASVGRGVRKRMNLVTRPSTADDVIAATCVFDAERRFMDVVYEVALGLRALPSGQVANVVLQDATYSDRRFGDRTLLTLATDENRSPTLEALVNIFGMIGGLHADRTEGLNIYVRHLARLSALDKDSE